MSSTDAQLPPGPAAKLTRHGPVAVDTPELPADPDSLLRAVELSRRVLRSYGHTWTAERPLELLTTSASVALAWVGDPRAVERWNADDLGVCWPTHGVIWVSPTTRLVDAVTPRSPSDMLATLAHEVAHLLTRGVHPEVWRHAFLVLLPLWLNRDPRPVGDDFDRWWHAGRSRAIVARYSRNRRPPGAEAAEVERHHRAACRAWDRWHDRFTDAMLTERVK